MSVNKEDKNILNSKKLWLICPKCKNIPLIRTEINNELKSIILKIECTCDNFKKEEYSYKEYLDKITKKQQKKVECTKNPSHSGYLAINYCFQCQEFLCSLCNTIHQTINKDHQISDEAIKIDKICDRHLQDNNIVSFCYDCKLKMCINCLKEHDIYHDIYDLKTFFPKNLCDKCFEDFKLIQVTFFKYINEGKKMMEEKIKEKEKEENLEEEFLKNLKNAEKNMNSVYNKIIELNHNLIKIIGLMFENYYNSIDITPNFNIIFQLKNLALFNNSLKQFKYDESKSILDNIQSFIDYIDQLYIIKTINTPLQIKEISKIPKLGNTRILLSLGGSKICSGNSEPTIQIFDITTKEVIKDITGHFSCINTLCTKDKYLLSSGCDSAINIYEIEGSKPEQEDEYSCYKGFVNEHEGTVNKLVVFKDGKIVSCGFDKKINIFGKIIPYETREDFPVIELTNEEKEKLEKEKEKLEKENEKEKTQTIESNKEEAKKEEEEVKEDAKTEADVDTYYLSLEKIETFILPDKVFDICELKDGSLIACCLDKTLRIYNMKTIKEEKTLKVDFVPNKVISLKDGRIVVAFGENKNFGIKIFKFNENKELIMEKEFVEHKKHITCLCKLEDGKILTTSLDGTAILYNPYDMKIICKITEENHRIFSSAVQLEDGSIILSSNKGYIYILQ